MESNMSDATHPEERWLPVPGWEGLYEVSDRGRIRGVDRVTRFLNGTRKVRGRLINQYVNRGGRLVVMLYRNGQCRCLKVQTLVLEAFIGPRPEGLLACHYDDDPFNNHVDNLRWDTGSSNQFDRVRNGNHYNASKTHCLRGHRLAEPNLRPSPRRACRACSDGWMQVRRARLKGVQLDLAAVADEKYARIMKETATDGAAK